MKNIILATALCIISFGTFAETYYVTAKSLNIRSGIGSQNPVVGKLTQGQQVDVKNQKDGWSQVDGGWVASSFLSKNQIKVINKKIVGKDIMLVCDCISSIVDAEYDEVNTRAFKNKCKKEQGRIVNLTEYIKNSSENKIKKGRRYMASDDFSYESTISWKQSDNGNILINRHSTTYYKGNSFNDVKFIVSETTSINRLTGTKEWSYYDHGKQILFKYQCKKAPEKKF